MTVPRVPAVPWSIYSHRTITSHRVHTHTPAITSSSPSYLWKETKTLLHTFAEVSNSDCPSWSHTSPEQSFHSAGCGAIFCIRVSKPGPPPSRFHAPVEAFKDGCGWRRQRSEDWKWHWCKGRSGVAGGAEGRDDGFVVTSACTRAINKQKQWMSFKYSDSVSSCCGLQSSSTIDLVSWLEVRGNKSSWSPNCGLQPLPPSPLHPFIPPHPHTSSPFPPLVPGSWMSTQDAPKIITRKKNYVIYCKHHIVLCVNPGNQVEKYESHS